MEITAGLRSLQFESGVAVQHQDLVKLRRRGGNLAAHACAHSVFFCQLLLQTRKALQAIPHITWQGFHVGVIGAGHLGKQLVHCLLDLTDLRADDISVSTRRPETLRELRDRGVRCFYDNVKLVRGAHMVFLCCLPSQLPAVCAEIRGQLSEGCVVYSLVSAVPLSRLMGLLSHSNVIRPEYKCDPRDDQPMCHQHNSLTERLKDGPLVRATIPGELQDAVGGQIYLVHGWHHTDSPPLCSLFPRFDLSRVQMKETPLSQHLAGSTQLRTQLANLYCTLLHVDPQQTSSS
ncbi:NADP-dependent oxidoreductase domain-containing protein 1 isoform X2 [Pyxicephalus adspersus]|uniref:NADP-dependent oxidoreductase domain-containing protein 1 isoform X2 n=1 Tax=Pyxicephalus adspersus TaxID=30357 RepID=UPI003B59898E